MRKWQVAALTIVVALLALTLAGCSKTAATVNGKAIPQSDVDKQMDMLKKQQPNIFEGAKGKELEKNFRDRFLDQLITSELVRQEAEKRGIKVSDKEINDKLGQIKKITFGNDEAKFNEALKQEGLTLDEFKNKIRDTIISDKMVNIIVKDITVADAEVQDYYDKNPSQFADPEQVRVRMIAVKSEKTAKKTLAEINGGADFAEKAKTVSDDPTKASEGDLGYRRYEDFPANLSNVIKGLAIGQVSDVVKDENGFYIFKVEDKKEARQKSFDEVKDDVKKRLLLEKQQNKFLAWVEELKKKAKIEK